MTEEFARCSAGIIRLFFVVFYSIAGLQLSIGKLKIVAGYCVFLEYKLTKLEMEGPNKNLGLP